MHTISPRTPTPEERRVIEALLKPDYASFGCLIILSGGLAWTFGLIGYWVGSFSSPMVASYARWAGWITGVALGLPILFALIPFDRKLRKLAERDHVAQLVQDIHVVDPRVIEVAAIGNRSPNLAIDIGAGKILYLQGQWLYKEELYGAVSPAEDEGDDGDDRFNGLRPPFSFPATEFVISRLPVSGEVLRIQVLGDYIQPGPPRDVLKPGYDFRPSELFSGSLDDIAGVLERACRASRSSEPAVGADER